MSQIKLAVVVLMPLAAFCSIATAQELPSCPTTATSQLKPKSQTPLLLPQPQPDEAYGPYVPYTGPKLPPPQQATTAVPQTACYTPAAQPLPPAGPQPTVEPPPQQAALAKLETTDVLSETCSAPKPRPDEVYGPYVPYDGPKLPPTACYTPNVTANASLAHSNSPTEPDGLLKSNGTAQLDLTPPTTNDLAVNSPPPPVGDPAGGGGYVRIVNPPRAAEVRQDIRPFRSIAIGFKVDTLGLGIELATPMAFKLNLRSSINFFAFDDPFSIDGINYTARLHLKSSETTVDWFPHGMGSFHVSPGILYFKSSMSAPAFVGPGQSFVLGTQAFINSVDDPVSGSSSVIYPRKFSPMLLLGYGNIIPRVRRHFSIPIEFGVAYTGAPQISVALNGTACTTNGCANFATNPQAQASLKQEIHDLNEDLKSYPVFPIVSVGFAYHF